METLFITDQESTYEALFPFLANLGQCQCCPSVGKGQEAFKTSIERHSPFDVVLVHLEETSPAVPNLIQVLREMERARGIASDQATKIISVVSYADEESIAACMRAGCDHYLVYPVTAKRLAAKLSYLGVLDSE